MKLKKININLFEGVTKKAYTKARAEFIATYITYEQGFLSIRTISDPIAGEAKWNSYYPEGFSSWAGKQRELNAYGQQEIIDSLNQIIQELNKKEEE